MKKTMLLWVLVLLMVLPVIGCTAVAAKVVNLEDVNKAVKDVMGDDYFADMQLEKEAFVDMFKVSADDIESFIAEVPGFSLGVDIFVAVKAKAGKGEAVEKALQDWRTFQIEEGFQYTMNMAKVKAAQVVRHGDYVFLLVLGKANDNQDATEAQQLEFAKQENQKAVDAVNKLFA